MDAKTKKRLQTIPTVLIPILFGVTLSGLLAWAGGINSDVVEMRIAQGKITTLIEGIDSRLKEAIDNGKRYEDLRNELSSIKLQSKINTVDLFSRRGIHFNMPDYDNYVRPVQNDLLQRVATVEARIDNK
jgi:hypothetical protein